MAAFVKFYDFIEALALKEHNLHTDTLKVYLTNATPDQTLDVDKADLAEIGAGNGYTAGGEDSQNTLSESGGTATVAGVDIVWTASGGTIGPFRYAVLYNDTHATDGLIGYWDYTSAITLQVGETFTVDFTVSSFTIA